MSQTPLDTPPSSEPKLDPRVVALNHRYWRWNVLTMTCLLAVWAAVGPGCAILFADRLNQWKIGGFPLGFWFAQQGAILVFVLLVFAYAILMNRLDRWRRAELDRLRGGSAGPTGGQP